MKFIELHIKINDNDFSDKEICLQDTQLKQ